MPISGSVAGQPKAPITKIIAKINLRNVSSKKFLAPIKLKLANRINKNTKLTRGDLMLALDITRLDFQKELAKFKSVVENPTKKQCNVMKAQLINELYGESINWSCCYKDIENLKFLPIIISKGSRKMNRSLKKQLKKMVGKCYLI